MAPPPLTPTGALVGCYSSRLTPPGVSRQIVKPSGGRSYMLRVDSETELSEWVKAITHNILLLQGKKSAAW